MNNFYDKNLLVNYTKKEQEELKAHLPSQKEFENINNPKFGSHKNRFIKALKHNVFRYIWQLNYYKKQYAKKGTDKLIWKFPNEDENKRCYYYMGGLVMALYSLKKLGEKKFVEIILNTKTMRWINNDART